MIRRIAKSLISVVVTLLLLEGLVRATDLDRRRLGDPFAQAEQQGRPGNRRLVRRAPERHAII